MRKSKRLLRQFFKKKSVSQFKDRRAVMAYLEKEVFLDRNFISNVTETATICRVSYIIAYECVTNYLTDIVYEIDQAITFELKKSKISVYSYFFLEVGFMVSLRDNKMYLEKYVNH